MKLVRVIAAAAFVLAWSAPANASIWQVTAEATVTSAFTPANINVGDTISLIFSYNDATPVNTGTQIPFNSFNVSVAGLSASATSGYFTVAQNLYNPYSYGAPFNDLTGNSVNGYSIFLASIVAAPFPTYSGGTP